jgi:prepilin-type N-terminal cleavage/methylation domain-containing protein
MDFSKAFRLNSLRRSNAGFTLIELAIVLIVVGLILSVIVKGGDLITDAQITNFITNPVRRAEINAMSYYTRTNTFASVNGTNSNGPLYNMWKVGIQDVINIRNPYKVGTDILALALGIINVQNSDGTYTNYPVIAIEPVAHTSGTIDSPGTQWTTTVINYATRLKTIIDGNQNWSAGAVRLYGGGVLLQTRFSSLQTELNSSSLQITNYDGYITNSANLNTPYISVSDLTLTPANAVGRYGSGAPLLYFYYQTPY